MDMQLGINIGKKNFVSDVLPMFNMTVNYSSIFAQSHLKKSLISC